MGLSHWGRRGSAFSWALLSLCSPPPRLGHLFLLIIILCFSPQTPRAWPSKHHMCDPLVQTPGSPAWGSAREGKSPLAPECAQGGVVTGQLKSLMCCVPLLRPISHLYSRPWGSALRTAPLKLMEAAPWMCPAGTLPSSLWSLLHHLLVSLPAFLILLTRR